MAVTNLQALKGKGMRNMSESGSGEPNEDHVEASSSGDDTDNQQGFDEPELGYEPGKQPDVYLDIPLLKVDEISLEVEDLHARVSLHAEVVDLLKLNVGVDATLGRVSVEIKGVEAQAMLKVRLDNVAAILNRVLTTIDRNPQILEHVTRGLESASRGVGEGAGEAVKQIGHGAGGAVDDLGQGAGETVKQVGHSTGRAAEDLGHGAGETVEEVGESTGGAVKEIRHGVAPEDDMGEDTACPVKGGQRARRGETEGRGRRGDRTDTSTDRRATDAPRRESRERPRTTKRDRNQ